MNPRYVLTVSLLPLAAVAACLAPMLSPLLSTTDAKTAVEAPPAPVAVTSQAPGSVHLSVVPDREVLFNGGDTTMRLRVDVWADPGSVTNTIPTDLVVVLDRSGSMEGTKLLDAKAAAAELVSQLRPEDRFGLVSFSSDLRIDAPLRVREGRANWLAAIDRLQSGGGTDLSSGLMGGLSEIGKGGEGRARRLVVISDGRPNSGAGLLEQAAASAREEVPMTTIGIGEDYDEALMQSLADAGGGNFYWTTRGEALSQVLASELSTARETAASGMVLSLTDGATLLGASGLTAENGKVVLGSLFAGQKRSLWLTVRVPSGKAADVPLGNLRLTYTLPSGVASTLAIAAPTVKVTADEAVALASLGDAWADSVVTDDYNRLKTEVAAAVQRGDKDGAEQAIMAYSYGNSVMNSVANNKAVTDNLREAEALQEQVKAQFEGDNQAERQNLWSKGTRLDAYDKRRSGQKKLVVPVPSPMP